MIGPGAQINPVSGQPIEAVSGSGRPNKTEEATLKRQARFAEISGSEAAQALRETVRRLLYGRISRFLVEDVEAKAYMKVLATMNEQEDLAARALDLLVRPSNHRTTR